MLGVWEDRVGVIVDVVWKGVREEVVWILLVVCVVLEEF